MCWKRSRDASRRWRGASHSSVVCPTVRAHRWIWASWRVAWPAAPCRPSVLLSWTLPTTSQWCSGTWTRSVAALTNVLLNAVEASSPDSPIALSVERTKRSGRSMVEVTVHDSGAGIPASRLESIWEPYVTHKAAGTGLGLAIVRQTLLAHDGMVEVESTPGEGTTMRLLLPADSPALD